jgi:non-specific protein-tyrosine kinase
MTLEQFLAAVLKRWKLVLLCFVLIGAGAALGSRFITPVYQSTVLVQVAVRSGDNQSEYTSLLASNELIQTETVLATSNPILREVSSHYKNISVDQLAKEVTATPRANTQLFEIDVQNADPQLAANLANDIAITLGRHQLLQTPQGTAQNNLVIVQNAEPSRAPIRPNVLLNMAVGLIMGLAIGLLLVVLFELLDKRIYTGEALAQLLDVPVLGTIRQAQSSKWQDIIDLNDQDINSVAYQTLRTNLKFRGKDNSLYPLMITSAHPQEGKSVIAANLAIFMARAGKITLLVDANLRHPTLHTFFGLTERDTGLGEALLAYAAPSTSALLPHEQVFYRTSALSEPIDTETAVNALEPFVHAVGIPRLRLMPAGKLSSDPSIMLDSDAMQKLLFIIKQCGAEIIIFDAPSLLGLPDASILASKLDSSLLVVDSTRTNKEAVKQAHSLLDLASSRVIGCVLNKQPYRRRDVLSPYPPRTSQQNGVEENHSETKSIRAALPLMIIADEDATVKVGQPGKRNGGRSESGT